MEKSIENMRYKGLQNILQQLKFVTNQRNLLNCELERNN